MRNHVKVAAIAAMSLVLFAGCGGRATSQVPEDSSYIPEDTLSVSEDTIMLGNENIADDESMTESEMIKTAGDTENTAGNIDEELPDYLRGDQNQNPSEPSSTDATLAEGLNVAAGTEITAGANAENCTLGETYTIHTDTGDIDLNVKSVDVVKNPDKSIAAKKIVRVSYSYTNISSESGMLIDAIFFRLANDKGIAVTTYIPDYSLEDNPEPKVVEKGDSCEAVIAFALYEDTDEMTLYFNDQTTGKEEAQELIWVIQ